MKYVPFYANPDSTHCYQTGLKMILKHFYPEREYSWGELDKITAKVEGLWTWPMAGMVWLQGNGFELKNVEDFDYERFIDMGEKYLVELFGEATADVMLSHSDIQQEYQYARQLLDAVDTDVRVPERQEMKDRLDEGYLVACNVNSQVFNGGDGYVGHFVLLIGYDSDGFVLHNPGPPSVEGQHVGFELFEKAWAYPNGSAKNYFAVREVIVQRITNEDMDRL